ELAITCRDGEVVLEGSLPSRDEDEILLGLLRDVAGVERIDDRIDEERTPWERVERAPRLMPDRPGEAQPEMREEDAESTSDPLRALSEGTTYSPPDRPLPSDDPRAPLLRKG